MTVRAPNGAGRWHGAGRWRVVTAFAIVFAGVAAILSSTPGPVVTWVGLILTGLLAGALAGRARLAWPSLPIVAIASAGAWWWSGGAETHRIYWWLGVAIAIVLVGVGFVVGTGTGWRRDPATTAASSWRGLSRPKRVLFVGGVVLAIVVLLGYTGYVGIVGSSTFMTARSDHPDCRTPAQVYGLAYEAINYDKATDPIPAPKPVLDTAGNTLYWACDKPVAAGTEVVSSDGVRLAGWYIPAAAGIGPSGLTVIVVPGWKANKSEILKYLPAFHDAYNVILMDVRNVGQSGDAVTTLGLHEQRDVRAMVDWLVAAKGPASIVLAGDSRGAATSLAEAAADPRIDALILDSMHANLVDTIGNGLEVENGQPSLPGAWAIAALWSLRVGGDVTSIDPVRMITRLGDRPVLLTHGTDDQIDRPAESVERNLHAAMTAGVPVELHYCPASGHGKTLETCPDEWARWATSFLEGALGH